MKGVSTITTKGQVTVPKELRDAFGWKPGDRVAFVREDDGVLIIHASPKGRGARMIEALRKMKFRSDGRTTDEILRETRSEV